MNPNLLILLKHVGPQSEPDYILPLTAAQRLVLRGRRQTSCGKDVLLQIPRNHVLKPGDCLSDETQSVIVQVIAASEPLMRVTAENSIDLMKADFHLGNRHVDVELHEHELWLLDDSVLKAMLEGRGLNVGFRCRSFFPEKGAYVGHHSS